MTQGGEHFLGDQHSSAPGAMLAFRQSRFQTGRCHGGIHHFIMAQGGNDPLADEIGIAAGAVLALRQAGFGTGGRHCPVDDLDMAQGGDHFLGDQHCPAAGTMLTLRQTGSGTGGRHGPIDDLDMAQGRHCILGDQHRLAAGAMLARSLACSGTGGGHRRIGNFFVAQGRDHFLGSEHRLAAGAMLAFRQTGGQAGGCHGFVDDFHMAQSRQRGGSAAALCAAGGTVDHRVIGTGGGTGLRHFVFSDSAAVRMAGGADGLGVGIAAAGAGEGLHACRFAAGLRGDHTIVIAVAGSRDGLLCRQNGTADRTAAAFRQTGLGAGGCRGRNSLRSMSRRALVGDRKGLAAEAGVGGVGIGVAAGAGVHAVAGGLVENAASVTGIDAAQPEAVVNIGAVGGQLDLNGIPFHCDGLVSQIGAGVLADLGAVLVIQVNEVAVAFHIGAAVEGQLQIIRAGAGVGPGVAIAVGIVVGGLRIAVSGLQHFTLSGDDCVDAA